METLKHKETLYEYFKEHSAKMVYVIREAKQTGICEEEMVEVMQNIVLECGGTKTQAFQVAAVTEYIYANNQL